MLCKKDLYKTNEYWVDILQNEIYRQVTAYMKVNELNQNQLAEKWNVSKGYVSQVLSGSCNFSIKKLVELSLALNQVPMLGFVPNEAYHKFEEVSKYIESQMNEQFLIRSSGNSTEIDYRIPSSLITIPLNVSINRNKKKLNAEVGKVISLNEPQNIITKETLQSA